MNINEIRIKNLKRIILENYNNSTHHFAKEIGRHSSQFYNLFKGDRSFGQKLARNLEITLKLAPLSLDRSSKEAVIIDKIALIEHYNINTIPDKILAEASNDIFAIEKTVIEHHGWEIDKLHGFVMDDESMSPTIPQNGKILIDISQVKLNNGKIYALSKNNQIFIKRIFKISSGTLYEAKSDNEQYETIEFKSGQIEVIGRVLCLLNQVL